jgi:hypothetical protein
MKINPMPKSGEDAFIEKKAPVVRQKVEAREKHAKTFEELSRAYARDPILIPIGISPRLRTEVWQEV